LKKITIPDENARRGNFSGRPDRAAFGIEEEDIADVRGQLIFDPSELGVV